MGKTDCVFCLECQEIVEEKQDVENGDEIFIAILAGNRRVTCVEGLCQHCVGTMTIREQMGGSVYWDQD